VFPFSLLTGVIFLACVVFEVVDLGLVLLVLAPILFGEIFLIGIEIFVSGRCAYISEIVESREKEVIYVERIMNTTEIRMCRRRTLSDEA
jgi:hypothetical protein